MRKLSLGLAVLMILCLALAGCAARPGGGQTAAAAADDDIMVDLPALALDFAEDGTGSIGGVSMAALMGGEGVSLPADTIQSLMDYNIQHVQLDAHPAGITVRVNGLPFLGSMAYDPERLQSMAAILGEIGDSPMLSMMSDVIPILTSLLPMIDNFGMGVVARFPAASGMEPMPLMQDSMAGAGNPSADFLAGVAQRPQIAIPIFLEADGGWSAGELNPALLSALLGAENDLSLPTETVTLIASLGIRSISLHTVEDGLEMLINDHPLPILTWNQGEVASLLEIVEQSESMETNLLGLVGTLIPLLQATDAHIALHFPDVQMG